MCTDILIYVQNICVCIYKHICAYSYTYVYLCVYKTKPNKKKKPENGAEGIHTLLRRK